MSGPMVPRRPGPMADSAGMTPKEIMAIFRRHIFLIISTTILGIILGIAGWWVLLRIYPRYTAQTFIKVFPPIERDPTAIAGQMANKDILYGYRLSMANLLRQQSTFAELLNDDKIQQTKWFQHFGKIKAVRTLKAMRDLEKRLGASAARDAEFITVAMTCGNDEESALIVNTMVNMFVSTRGTTRRQEVSGKLAGLNDQLNRVERELGLAERALTELRRTSGFSDLKEHTYEDAFTKKLTDLEQDRNKISLDISHIRASIGNLEQQALGPINEQVKDLVERDPTVVMLTQQLVSQETALAGLLMKFGENHRIIREVQERVNETRLKKEKRTNEIANQTRQANLKNAQDQLVVLQKRLEESQKMQEEISAKKAELDFARAQYKQREDIRDERRKTLDQIKIQVDKYKIMYEDPETPRVQAVGLAPVPLEPSFPKLKVFVPAGTVLGLMLGMGLAFLIEFLNDLVRTPKDVVKYLHIPLLGIIPDADEDDLLEDVDLCHVLRQAPYSIVSESYRRFRTNLILSGDSESTKVLLVSSGMAGDGTTSTAVNLATALVSENKKVLLIDTNFWQPSLNIIFPHSQLNSQISRDSEFGLSTLLFGICESGSIIRSTGIEGFDLIDSGPLPTNPAELLSGKRMEQLIKQQRQIYDHIVIDGPPVLLVSAAKDLAKLADGTVLVFNADATKRGAAIRTIRELKEVETRIVGCVLLGAKALKGGYFNEQFKSYQKYQELQLAHSV